MHATGDRNFTVVRRWRRVERVLQSGSGRVPLVLSQAVKGETSYPVKGDSPERMCFPFPGVYFYRALQNTTDPVGR